MTGCGLDNQGSIRDRGGSYPIVTRVPPPWKIRPGREAIYSINAEFRYAWSFPSTSPISLYRIVLRHRANLFPLPFYTILYKPRVKYVYNYLSMYCY